VIIRQALASDIEPAVAVLMAGFFTDPVLVWLVPDDRTRRRFARACSTGRIRVESSVI
jgi:hypothetical protein